MLNDLNVKLFDVPHERHTNFSAVDPRRIDSFKSINKHLSCTISSINRSQFKENNGKYSNTSVMYFYSIFHRPTCIVVLMYSIIYGKYKIA